MVESGLSIAGAAQDSEKTLTESAIKQEIDVAIKIAWEKIIVLLLFNGTNYQQYHNALSN